MNIPELYPILDKLDNYTKFKALEYLEFKLGFFNGYKNAYVCEICDKIEKRHISDTIEIQYGDYINQNSYSESGFGMEICHECSNKFKNNCTKCKTNSTDTDVLTCDIHAKLDREEIIRLIKI